MEEGLRRRVLDDERYTVQRAPGGAPAHRVASFRTAAEGLRRMRQGDLGAAEELLEKALSQDPRNPFAYLYLAEIRLQRDEARQALVLLNQAEVLFQDHPYWLGEVYTRKGNCLEALHAPAEAKEAFEKALEYNPWNEQARERLKRERAHPG